MTTPAQTFPPLYDLSVVPPGRVLVVAPHPDDEIIGCGGAIALHVQRGDEVHVALVTGGEGGGSVEERLAESREAAESLGSPEVTCLGARDGAVAADAGLAERLGTAVARVDPAIVYAPSPFEMHPDHVATLAATSRALAGREVVLLLYEVNTECMASYVLDISPVWPLKRRALDVFATQINFIDVVDKVDARNRARTVNIPIDGVTHAEGYLRVAPGDVPAILEQLRVLAAQLGLSAAGS